MSRKSARDYTFKLIFEYLFSKEKDSFTLDLFLNDSTLTDQDKEYIIATYKGATEHFDELTSYVEKYAKGFTLSRMFKPDLAGLVLAIYEMKYVSDIPMTVSISEGVELVKSYSTEKSNSFVNGILASVYKELKGEN